MKKRPDDSMPWMPGFRYGALLPPFSVNLIVQDTARTAAFYRDVFEAEVHYQDVDFAALRVGPVEVMAHADHTHDAHPWVTEDLARGAPRGVGLQLRVLGVDPDALYQRALASDARVVEPPESKGHGWREVLIRDPDGYEWACGVLVGPALGPAAPLQARPTP